jgi:hypothetical protein
MRGKDFVPTTDAAFNQWQIVLIAYLVANADKLGLPAAAITALQTLQAAWQTAFAAAEDPATRTPAAIMAKKEALAALVKEIRAFVKEHITYNRSINDVDRTNMGLPVHDNKPTPVPPPASMPIGEVDFSVHQRHSVHVKDASLTAKAKPENAHGFEVWYKIGGDAPTKDSDFAYAGFSSRSPFPIDYPMDAVGKTVYYRSRWVNARNQPGPWSETVVSAVVA